MENREEKWSLKTDIIYIWKPYVFFLIYILWVIFSQKISFVSSIEFKDGSLLIGTRMFYYLHFLSSAFISLVAATLFEEAYKKISLEYIRTLPLSLYEIWIKRYIFLVLLFMVVYIPVCIVLCAQLREGVFQYAESFSIPISDTNIRKIDIIFYIFIVVNFCALSVQLLMIVFRHKTVSVSLVIIHMALEYGPIGEKLEKKSVFYWSFNPILVDNLYNSGFWLMFSLSVIIFIIVTFWFRNKIH